MIMANWNQSTVAVLEHLESRLMLSGDSVLPSHSLFNPNGYLTEASQEAPLDSTPAPSPDADGQEIA